MGRQEDSCLSQRSANSLRIFQTKIVCYQTGRERHISSNRSNWITRIPSVFHLFNKKKGTLRQQNVDIEKIGIKDWKQNLHLTTTSPGLTGFSATGSYHKSSLLPTSPVFEDLKAWRRVFTDHFLPQKECFLHVFYMVFNVYTHKKALLS